MTAKDPLNHSANEPSPLAYGEHLGPRIVIDKDTGYPCVASRPGARKITPEDVKKMLEDFPFCCAHRSDPQRGRLPNFGQMADDMHFPQSKDSSK